MGYRSPPTKGRVLHVFAYLDPGSGSMLVQLLVGGVAAAGVTARLYWRRITRVFRRDRPDLSPTDPDREA